MYKEGQIFVYDDKFDEIADWCNKSGKYYIADYDALSDGTRQFIIKATPKDDDNEIDELKHWFNFYYREHEEKYRRLIFLEKTLDDGSDPNEELKQLYILAEKNRIKIQQLELKLDNAKSIE